jgi:ATP-binding cassette subfamily B protein RaxB
MVAGAHGLDTDLPALRSRFQISMKGATAADVCEMGAALGLAPRALRAEPEQLAQLSLPAVLHWDLNHFVVLAGLKRGVATVHDPARGVRRLSLAELSPHFSGVALEFTPTAAFVPRRERQPVRLRELMGRVLGWKRALGQVLLLALALELLVLGSPFFLQWVVDSALPTGDRDLLLTLGVGFGGLVLLQSVAAAAAPGRCCTCPPRSSCSGWGRSSPTCCGCRWSGSSAATPAMCGPGLLRCSKFRMRCRCSSPRR